MASTADAPPPTGSVAHQLAVAFTRIGLDDDAAAAASDPHSKNNSSSVNTPRPALIRELEWVEGAMQQANLTHTQRNSLIQLLTSLQPHHTLTPYVQQTFDGLTAARRTISNPAELAEREETFGLKNEDEEDLEQIESETENESIVGMD